MKNLSRLIGALIILGGIALGLYAGLWIMFIGGIVQLVEAVKLTPINSIGVAFGIAKILLAWPVGWLIGIGSTGLGIAIMSN